MFLQTLEEIEKFRAGFRAEFRAESCAHNFLIRTYMSADIYAEVYMYIDISAISHSVMRN